jgi:hypothetical protein
VIDETPAKPIPSPSKPTSQVVREARTPSANIVVIAVAITKIACSRTTRVFHIANPTTSASAASPIRERRVQRRLARQAAHPSIAPATTTTSTTHCRLSVRSVPIASL